MKIQLFVAVALATGGYAFAAKAGQADVAGSVMKVQKTPTGSPKPASAGGEKRQAKANATSGETRRVALTGQKSSGNAKSAKRPKSGKRQRVVIDMTTTASIGKFSAVAPGKTKLKSSVTTDAGAAGSFAPVIQRYAAQYGVPVKLAQAVIRVESNYRVRALGSAGEIGLMQIKPATARMLGYGGTASGLYDPETNIRFGMKYLAMAHGLGGGDTCGTILRYNAGHAATRMNPISAAYCVKVKQHMAGL